MVNVLMIQNFVIDYDFKKNCENIIDLIEEAMLKNKNKKDLIICLPEYCWTGYIEKGYKEYSKKYPKIIKGIVKKICLKYKCYIQPGTYIIEKDNKFYNYGEVYDPNGKVICKYYKENRWMPYERGLTSGRGIRGNKNNFFKIGGVKIGLLICYDSSFPHMYKRLIKKGVEIILVPTLDYFERAKIREKELVLIHPALSFIYSVYIVCTEGRGLGGCESFITDMYGDFLYRFDCKDKYKSMKLDVNNIKKVNKNPYIIRNQMIKNALL